MYIPLVAEFVGTFLFLGTIRATSGNPIYIAVALALAVFLTAGLSGGNLNPAVSVMSYLVGDLPLERLLPYVLVQVIAGVSVAWSVPKLF